MSRETNVQIANDTLKIIAEGQYIYNGHTVPLLHSHEEIASVMLYTAEQLEKLVMQIEKPSNSSGCEWLVANIDSFEAVAKYAKKEKSLVLNFASAKNPGGGFLSGASAQEESLCRCSTLYASLSSAAAESHYDANRRSRNPLYSDAMLLSPCVDVFRTADGLLSPRMFSTAVITAAAPNLRGPAAKARKVEIEDCMKRRIRMTLAVAAERGYEAVVLGAWGCGAFGHDAKDVAGYFKEVIAGEKMYRYFKKIIFAVYDNNIRQYNYKSFLDAFGKQGTWLEKQ